MHQPPPLPKRPRPVMETFLRGFFYLLVGIAAEAITHPAMPWSFIPGTLILLFGIGVGMALLDRTYPRWAIFVFVAIGIGIMIMSFQQATSLLPVFLYLASFNLTRWILLLDPAG